MTRPVSAGRPFAWRIALRSIRTEWLRAVVVAAVCAFASVVCFTASVTFSVAQQQLSSAEIIEPVKGSASSGLWVAWKLERYKNHDVRVMRVHGDDRSGLPRVPGVPVLPREGEMLTSPALAQLMESSPAIRQRYPQDYSVGVPQDLLRGPRTNFAIIGMSKQDVAAYGGTPVGRFVTPGTSDLRVPSVVKVGAPVIATMLLVPTLWLLFVVSRVGSRQRQSRLQALSLMGYPRRSITLIEAGQATVASIVGSGVGLAIVLATRNSLLPLIPLGDGVWPADLTIRPMILLSSWLTPGILVAIFVVGGRSGVHIRSVGRQSRQPRGRPGLRWLVCLGLGSLALLASNIWPEGDATGIRLSLLVTCMLLWVVSLVQWQTISAGPDLFVRSARSVRHLLAARSMRASGTSGAHMGLALMIMAAGILLSIFPLLRESGVQERSASETLLGSGTFVASFERPLSGAQVAQLAHLGPVSGLAAIDVRGSNQMRCWNFALEPDSTRAKDGSDCLDLSRTELDQIVTAGGSLGAVAPQPVDSGSSPAQGFDTIIVQSEPGNVEAVRTVLINDLHPAGLKTLTMSETALEGANDSRPFIVATVAMLALSGVVACITVVIGLIGHVLERQSAWRQLFVVGLQPRGLVQSLRVGVVAGLGSTLIFAIPMSILTSWTFLNLNAQGGRPPTLWLIAISAAALAFTALAVSALRPWVAIVVTEHREQE